MNQTAFVFPDVDTICQSIFAGTVALGRPDPFLARELADSAMHFIAQGGDATSESAIGEAIVKLVRELGHPELARVIAADSVQSVWSGYSTSPDHDPYPADNNNPLTISRTRVFPSNLIAAHDAGLLTLYDLELPDKIVGDVIERPNHCVAIDWTRRLFEIRQRVGQFVVFDGAEYYVGPSSPVSWMNATATGLKLAALDVVFNLNTGPTESDSARSLFSARQRSLWDHDELEPAVEILKTGLSCNELPSTTQWRWHLSAMDFEPERRATLTWLAKVASGHANVSFVFDRPREAVMLADGIDRRVPAIVQRVQVSLPALFDYLSPGSTLDAFIDKSGSLIRLALSAGHAKRAFLRAEGSPEVREAFRSERSAQLLIVHGWDEVADRFFPADVRTSNVRRSFQYELRRRIAGAADGDTGGPTPRVLIPEEVVECNLAGQGAIESHVKEIQDRGARKVLITGIELAEMHDRLVLLLELLWLATDVNCVHAIGSEHYWMASCLENG